MTVPTSTTAQKPSLLSAVLSGIAGRGIAILAGIVAPPLVARRLGVDSWGVVGAFGAISTLTALLDVGLSTTLTREVAHTRAEGSDEPVGDLIVTFTGFFGLVALALFAVLSLFLVLGGSAWAIGPEFAAFPDARAVSVLAVLGVAASFPQIALGGALNGLDRQPTFALLTAGGAVARSLGGLLVVTWLPSLTAYFGWLALSTTLVTLAMAWATRDVARSGHFRPALLKQSAGYAASVWLTSALGLLLSQFDKLLVPRLAGLRAGGRYAFAVTASGALYSFVAPAFSVALTRLSASQARLQPVYTEALSIMLGVLTPASLVLSAFAPEALLVWTRDPTIVAEAALPLRVLSLGVFLHGIAHVPYALSLATGHARIGVWQNLVACAVFLPLGWAATGSHGAIGAAAVWALITTFFVTIAGPVINHISRVSTAIYFATILRLALPVALVVVVSRVIASRLLEKDPDVPRSNAAALTAIAVVAAAAVATSISVNPVLRGFVSELRARRNRASGPTR